MGGWVDYGKGKKNSTTWRVGDANKVRVLLTHNKTLLQN